MKTKEELETIKETEAFYKAIDERRCPECTGKLKRHGIEVTLRTIKKAGFYPGVMQPKVICNNCSAVYKSGGQVLETDDDFDECRRVIKEVLEIMDEIQDTK